jgi:hypothetical protein
MNYDPYKFCRECQSPQRRDGFRMLPATNKSHPNREACEKCYAKIQAKREAVKRRAAA